jgi:hypothetical protein
MHYKILSFTAFYDRKNPLKIFNTNFKKVYMNSLICFTFNKSSYKNLACTRFPCIFKMIIHLRTHDTFLLSIPIKKIDPGLIHSPT